MTVRIEYTEDSLGVVLHSTEIVTGEELIAAIKEVYSDERYITLRYWIGDRTACEKYLVTEKELKEIAKLNEKESRRNPGMLLALVGPSDAIFGASRQYAAHGDSTKFVTMVFRDRPSAEDWIYQTLRNAPK